MTPREALARELREEHAGYRAARGFLPLTPWEDLPHERKRKWLDLAARAERVIAARPRVGVELDLDDIQTLLLALGTREDETGERDVELEDRLKAAIA
jgi:hypothetical protein